LPGKPGFSYPICPVVICPRVKVRVRVRVGIRVRVRVRVRGKSGWFARMRANRAWVRVSK
jgi:hypothetical protein